MPTNHALLSASSAHRWLECTKSARLESKFPEMESEYAKEGTLAHALCEKKLTALLSDKPMSVALPGVDPEMDEYTDSYVEFVENEFAEAKKATRDAQLLIEQKLSFTGYVPEGFGTADAVIISDDTLEVIDFKYGRGVPVNALGNPQLRLYALGAWLTFGSLYEFTKVKPVVVQPRLNSTSFEELSVDELLTWAETYVKPRAEEAFAGSGEFVSGDHCRFCRAGATCIARIQASFDILSRSATDPALIDDSEIPGLLDKCDAAMAWMTALHEYAQNRAISEGKRWDGYKLVESRTQRRIGDPIAAAQKLEANGFSREDITDTKLKGLSSLEKIVGKAQFAELLGNLIVKPEGTPTLVKDTDKRPEITPLADAFKEGI